MKVLKTIIIILLVLLVLELTAYFIIARIQEDKKETVQEIGPINLNSPGKEPINYNANLNLNSHSSTSANVNSSSSLNANFGPAPAHENINTPSNPPVIEEELVFRLEGRTDKQIYYSNERIILEIGLTSNQDFNNLEVEARGIANRWGQEYFSKNQFINLTASQSEKITFISTLPSCSSCSGINPGDYEIEITAVSGAQVIKSSSVTIILRE